MLRDYLRRKCEDMNIYIPGLEVKNNPRTPKSVRLESLQPHFCRKKMFIRKDMTSLEDELLMYPRGKHDDLLDGFFYANKNAYKPHHEASEEGQTDDYYDYMPKSWKIM